MILGLFTIYFLDFFYSYVFLLSGCDLDYDEDDDEDLHDDRIVIGDLSGAKIRQNDFLSSTSRVDFRLN